MSKKKPRPRVEIARAVLRLATETLVPVTALCDELDASPGKIIRYAIEGEKIGDKVIHLDALHDPVKGWMSSQAAAERFIEKCERAVTSQAARAKPQPHG